MELRYFGTNKDTAGHYLWFIYKDSISKDHNGDIFKLPFYPEALPYKVDKFTTGEKRFYNAFGFTILAMTGSVGDKRPGGKSIFFVEKDIDFEQMERLVRSSEFGQHVLTQLSTPKP